MKEAKAGEVKASGFEDKGGEAIDRVRERVWHAVKILNQHVRGEILCHDKRHW